MLTFKQTIPNLKFQKAVKKPIPIKCIQIDEPFVVETLEGTMKGNKGDWLMVGVSGEMYPCDKEIFKKTYNLVK
ncbi:hypothetical protein [Pontimicrobium aquaticum]|uniref:Uncharacterized protein n=1 Tax=Pontimicrobium aquaticum TaxID=2565367 RepID=A0A4U0EL59_9FLAO|nr:hypothetical protein [Pontimicrobium aquaticum]TJY32160.1 hypothetical protein E5167_14445 [Pontimicrobium aquaticum]